VSGGLQARIANKAMIVEDELKTESGTVHRKHNRPQDASYNPGDQWRKQFRFPGQH